MTTVDQWFVKLSEDEIHGPLSLEMLKEWAENGKIEAGQVASRDCREWVAVESLPELDMVWLADLGGGRTYGPFNILASGGLVERGILRPDTVFRKRTYSAEPVVNQEDVAGRPDDPVLSDRIVQLEEELGALRSELSDIKPERPPIQEPPPREDSRAADGVRALTSTGGTPLSAAIVGLVDKVQHTEDLLKKIVDEKKLEDEPTPAPAAAAVVHETLPVETQWPAESRAPEQPRLTVARRPRSDLIDDPDVLDKLARTRRLRAHSLRWNTIASSILLGAGVTIGSFGYMLELVPLQFAGLFVAIGGLLYFILGLLMFFFRWAFARAHVQVAPTADGDLVHHEPGPLRGVLNISITWFSRAFRSKP